MTCQCRRHKRDRFNPWVKKITWSRKWQPAPVFLPGKFHGQRSLAGYSPWGCKELDMTMRTCTHTHTHTHTSTLGQGHFGHHHLGTGRLHHLESGAQGCRQTSYKESSNPKVSNSGLDGWGSNHCASAQGCDWGVLRTHLASGMDPWPIAQSEDTAVVKDKGGTVLA